MKSILITGGLGFIGSHTCVSLLRKEVNIFIVDSLVNSSAKTLKAIKKILERNDINFENKLFFFKGDIRDELFLRNVFNYAKEINKPINAVIHFAALKAVGESVNSPLKYWDNNVIGSICLFKVMEEYNCQTIVFSSSASVYGAQHRNKITEFAKVNPINPYGNTKAAIEKVLDGLYLSCSKKWRIANLRYFNPIGAHKSGLIGEDPNDQPNNLFPIICRVALGRYENLKIYGNDWDTIDGTGVRDYIHVMDLAEAHLSSLEYLLKNKSQFITLNIGTGIATSVLELVKKFAEINNCSIPYEFSKRRPGDTSFLVADNKLALSTINWMPKRNLDDMCRDGWKFYAKN